MESAGRHRPGALVVQKLRPPLDLLGRLRGRIIAEIRANSESALDRGAFAQFLEPAFEIRKFFDVLILAFPVDCPGIGDDVGDGVGIARQVAAVVSRLFSTP